MDLSSLLPRRAGIVLRSAHPDDADFLCELEYCERTKAYSSIPLNKTKAQWKLDFNRTIASAGIVVVESVSTGERAGRALLSHPAHGTFEIQVFIAPRFWGAGFGIIAARELVSIAFNQLGAKSVFAVVHPDNRAALRLLSSLGFVRDASAERGDWQKGHYTYRRQSDA
jgi:RimJ/RimL family protein N-acetyltransferase